jgi:hypothetical protein
MPAPMTTMFFGFFVLGWGFLPSDTSYHSVSTPGKECTLKTSDRNLGLDRPIWRRDILLGMGASAANAFVPGRAFADEMLRLEGASGLSAGYFYRQEHPDARILIIDNHSDSELA